MYIFLVQGEMELQDLDIYSDPTYIYSEATYDTVKDTPAASPVKEDARPSVRCFIAVSVVSMLMAIGAVVFLVICRSDFSKLEGRLEKMEKAVQGIAGTHQELEVRPDDKIEERLRFLEDALQVDCPRGWVLFESKCYQYVRQSETWSTAHSDCKKKGADLASITTSQTNHFLTNMTRGLLHIGGQKAFSNLVWTDGSPWAYTNWASGQPGGADEPSLLFSNGQWHDYPSDKKAYYRVSQRNVSLLFVCFPHAWAKYPHRGFASPSCCVHEVKSEW
jgi:hypothetical protein